MMNENELYLIRDLVNDRIKFLTSLNPTKPEFIEKNNNMRRTLLILLKKIDDKLIGGNANETTPTF